MSVMNTCFGCSATVFLLLVTSLWNVPGPSGLIECGCSTTYPLRLYHPPDDRGGHVTKISRSQTIPKLSFKLLGKKRSFC